MLVNFKMTESCSECESKLKSFELNLWGDLTNLRIPYCPKCEKIPDFNVQQLLGVSGKAQRGIKKSTGEFRMKVFIPEDFKQDLIVRTFPSYRVTTPSEWRYSRRRRFYKTKEKVSKVFPELKRNDEVSVVGIWEEGTPLYSILMYNHTMGFISSFIQEEIKIKTGIFSSFSVKNPLLLKSEELLKNLHGKNNNI